MQQRKKEVDTLASVRILVFATINVLAISTINAAPAAYDPELEMKSSWLDNSATPIISQPCSTGGRCWELLSASPIVRDDEAYVFQEESTNARLQIQRQADVEADSAVDQWKQDSALLLPAVRSPSSPVVRHIPPRAVKKDVFMSRSWGPGGHPFSVLYMNPHAARASNHPNNGMAEVVPTKITPDPTAGRSFEAPLPTALPTKHPNYRVALRNGASGQPRRQYSIIPQLFISYGWGPLGK